MTDASVTHIEAIDAFVNAVAAYFVAAGITATVDLGWTKRYRQDNQGPGGANRVIFIPGEFDASPGAPRVLKYGAIDLNGAQNQVSLAPRLRTIAWLHAPYTCSVWGYDASDPTNERKQIVATKNLLRLTMQAMQNGRDPVSGQATGGANVEAWGIAGWTLPPGEMGFGRELTFEFVLIEPQYDAGVDLAYPSPAVARLPAT